MKRVTPYLAKPAGDRCTALARFCCIVWLMAVATGYAAAARDTGLERLSAKLDAILDRGQLTGLALDSTQKVALLDARFGVRADYQAWIGHVRAYRRQLEELHAYRDLPLVAELCDDPINVPWRFDSWLRELLAGSPGVDTALRVTARLDHAVFGASTEPPRPARLPRALDRFVAAMTNAAAIVDQQALGAVSPQERELLRQVIPWICRGGGQFYSKSKGSPSYEMTMGFDPADGDTNALPPALRTAAGLNGYLHALAGQPITNSAPLRAETNAPTEFRCQVDFAALQRAFAVLQTVLTASELDALHAELQQMKPGRIETAYGPIIIGSSGPDRYEDVDALAILEPGGDDDYIFNHPEAQIGKRGVQVIVDFAGDDVYETHGVGGPGAGLLGIGILIDRAGNDRYCQGLSPLFQPRAHTRATLVQSDPEGVRTSLVPFPVLFGNPAKPDEKGVALDAGFAFGAGFLGIGVLVDEAGDDLYLGQKLAFGCGFWRGVGVLHDASGNDVYAAGLAAFGVGINGAAGLLDDRAGADHYQCLGTFESAYSAGQNWDNGYMCNGIGFGSSWRAEKRDRAPKRRPTLGGGLGIVHDAAGNDCYVGASFGVAASYAGGVGAVVDDAGDDTYFVKRGPGGDNYSGWSGNHALGNGCHRGIGYLLDRAGNDRYSASGLGGGTAWDMASGYLLDLGGDDAMTDLHGKGLRGNTGWGAAKGFAVSFHQGGHDIFERSTLGDASAIGDGYPGVGGNFSFFFHTGAERAEYPAGYTNGVPRLSGVNWRKEADGREYPEGIGVFWDGNLPGTISQRFSPARWFRPGRE